MAKRRKTIYAGDMVYDVVYTIPTPQTGEVERKAIHQISDAAMAKWNCTTATRKMEMRMAAAFSLSDLVITLTYREEDLPDAFAKGQRRLNTFIRQLRDYRRARGLDLLYIKVHEGRHGDHRLHHHIIINATGNDLEIIKSLWQWGDQIDLSYIADKGYEGWAVYLSKERREASLNGKKMFVCSRNCPKPDVEYAYVDDGVTIEPPPGAMDITDSADRNAYASYRYLKYRLPRKQNKVSYLSDSKLSLTYGQSMEKLKKRCRREAKKLV